MARLFVITVPSENLRPPESDAGYAVLLADCVLPGHILGRYPDLGAANAACEHFAEHYELQAHPLDLASHRRAMFTVIEGGAPC